MPIAVRTFGLVEVTRNDVLPGSSLQPKRLALLVYIAAGHGADAVSRQTLMGVLWPELDEHRARNALDKSLQYLRDILGDGALLSVGHTHVGVDEDVVHFDAAGFRKAVNVGEVGRDLRLRIAARVHSAEGMRDGSPVLEWGWPWW